MPNYDYHCDACGADFELFQSMKDEPLKLCPKCQRPQLRRLIGTGAGIVFKGGGFYETDYKRSAPPSESVKESPSKKENAPSSSKPSSEGSAG